MKAGRRDDAVAAVEEELQELQLEQMKALGYVVSEDAEVLHSLRDTLAAPAAAMPARQNELGKQLLEEGRDTRRSGSKRK
jgi:hypothetical protein